MSSVLSLPRSPFPWSCMFYMDWSPFYMVSASHTDIRRLPHISQSCVCVCKKKCKCLWHQQPYYPSVLHPFILFLFDWHTFSLSQCSSISIAIICIGQTNNSLNNQNIHAKMQSHAIISSNALFYVNYEVLVLTLLGQNKWHNYLYISFNYIYRYK